MLLSSLLCVLPSPSLSVQVQKLNDPLAETAVGTVSNVEPEPLGSRVLYQAARADTFQVDLYVIEADGTEPPTMLNEPGVGSVLESAFSHDGICVVYRSEQFELGKSELFSVPSTPGSTRSS